MSSVVKSMVDLLARGDGEAKSVRGCARQVGLAPHIWAGPARPGIGVAGRNAQAAARMRPVTSMPIPR